MTKSILALSGGVVLSMSVAVVGAPEPLVGGPLAGLNLPPLPTQHGEPAGFPGCLPDPKDPAKLLNPTEGLSAQVELYPGSVENWRANDFKYLPTRSLYDAQTLVKNWKAAQFGAPTETYSEPLYWNRRHSLPKLLDVRNAAVPVARLRVKSPVVALDCGELPQSLYVIRVIGAVDTPDLIRHRKPLYLRMAVNDGLKGEESVYRFRAGYCDQFYMIGEFFFHLPEARRCKVRVWADEGSLVEPLVHNIELHDALAAQTRKALKTIAVDGIDPAGAVGNLAQEQRLERDAALWNSLPAINTQLGFVYGGGKDDGASNQPNRGAAGRAKADIEQEWGVWKAARPPLLAVNDKLKLQYSLADLAAHRPLPDPYPFKDDGCGLWYAGETPQNWYPVADLVRDAVSGRVADMTRAVELFRQKKDADAARDAAVLLCRIAYDFPARISADNLGFITVQPGPYAKDWFCRQRCTMEFWHYGDVLLKAYDQLFPFIRRDDALAASVNRFVPWVRTPDDVVKLIDTYLVQEHAKRLMRYNTLDSNNPARPNRQYC